MIFIRTFVEKSKCYIKQTLEKLELKYVQNEPILDSWYPESIETNFHTQSIDLFFCIKNKITNHELCVDLVKFRIN